MIYIIHFNISLSKCNVWRRFSEPNSPPLFLGSEKRHLWVSPTFKKVLHTDFIYIHIYNFFSLPWSLAPHFSLPSDSPLLLGWAVCSVPPLFHPHPSLPPTRILIHPFREQHWGGPTEAATEAAGVESTSPSWKNRDLYCTCIGASLDHLLPPEQSRRLVYCHNWMCSNYMHLISMVTGLYRLVSLWWLAGVSVMTWNCPLPSCGSSMAGLPQRSDIITVLASGSRLSNERHAAANKQEVRRCVMPVCVSAPTAEVEDRQVLIYSCKW